MLGVKPKIGEVYLIDFPQDGHTQGGIRPGVIFQNDVGNKYSPNVVVLPLTTSIKKISQPTHVYISSKNSGLRYDSIVLCENPISISKDRISKKLTKLSSYHMTRITEANLLASSAIAYLSFDELLHVWEKSQDFADKRLVMA